MKLYWRIKKNGKWTWTSVKCPGHDFVMVNCSCLECSEYNSTVIEEE